MADGYGNRASDIAELVKAQQYVDQYIQKLQASLDSYEKTDQATAESLPKGEA